MIHNLDLWETYRMVEDGIKTKTYDMEKYYQAIEFFCLEDDDADSAIRFIDRHACDSEETKQMLINKICHHPKDAYNFLNRFEDHYDEKQKAQLINACLQNHLYGYNLLKDYYNDLNRNQIEIIVHSIKRSKDYLLDFYNYGRFKIVELDILKEMVEFTIAQGERCSHHLRMFIVE